MTRRVRNEIQIIVDHVLIKETSDYFGPVGNCNFTTIAPANVTLNLRFIE